MNKSFLIVLLAFALVSCQSYKKVPYLQDAEVVLYGVQNEQLYDAKIMPKDLLTIVVSCTSPELAAPFNLTVATQGNIASNYTTTQPVLQQYLVDNEGKINFPVYWRSRPPRCLYYLERKSELAGSIGHGR